MGKKSKKKSKSDYDKLLNSALLHSGVKDAVTLLDFAKAWRRLENYFEGVPWEAMTPAGRRRLQSVIEDWMSSLRTEKLDEFIREASVTAPWVRPALFSIIEYLVNHPYVIEEYVTATRRERSEIISEIAEETGYSRKTVTQAFWSLRAAGLLE